MHHKKGTRVFNARLNRKHEVGKHIDVFREAGLRKRWDKYVEFEVKDGEVVWGKETSPIMGGRIAVTLYKGSAENPSIKGIVVAKGGKKDAVKLFKAESSPAKKSKGKAEDFDIFELDALVFVMLSLTVIHAYRAGKIGFCIVLGLLALVTEQASIRLGRTHCHAEGIVMVSHCSSGNSVLYYIPWMYACITSGENLVNQVGGSKWLVPWVVGFLHFAFCGPYEMQGPSMKWWSYPSLKTNLISQTDNGQWYLDQENVPKGIEASEHVIGVLAERWRGMPIFAPVFHIALGFGFTMAQAVTGKRTIPTFILALPIAWLWTLPLTQPEKYLGVHKLVSGPLTLVASFFLPLAVFLYLHNANVDVAEEAPAAEGAGAEGKGKGKGKGKSKGKDAKKADAEEATAAATYATPSPSPVASAPDYLLFLIPFANAAYFSTVYWRYPGKIKNDLYLATAVVNALSVVAHAYGSGVITLNSLSRPAGLRQNGFFDKLGLVCGNAQASEEGSPTGFVALTLQVLMVVYAWLRYVNDATMNGQGKQFLIYKVGAAALVPHLAGWLLSYGFWSRTPTLIQVQKVGHMTSAAITLYFMYTTTLGLAFFRELLVAVFFIVYNYLAYWAVDARIEVTGRMYEETRGFWSAYLFSWVLQAARVVFTGLPVWLLIVDGKRAESPEFTSNELYALGGVMLGVLLRWFADGSETDFAEKIVQSAKGYVSQENVGPIWSSQSFVWRMSRSAVELSDLITFASLFVFAQVGYESDAARNIVLATWGAGALWTVVSTVAFRTKQVDSVWANQEAYQKHRASTPLIVHEYILVAVVAACVGAVYMK